MLKRSYEIILRTPTGVTIQPIGNALSVKWALKESKPGTCVLDLPVTFRPGEGWVRSNFGEDYIIDIWRRDLDGVRRRVGNSSFFIQNIWTVRESGVRKIRLECDDGKALMSRRINAWRSVDSEQDYAGAGSVSLDVFMQQVFNRTFGLAEKKYTTTVVAGVNVYGQVQDVNRELDPTWLGATIINGPAVNTSQWSPTNHQSVLALLQKAVDYGASKGENIFWTVENNVLGATPFMLLKIYVGLRGVDRTTSVILSDFDGIADYKVGIAYRDTARRMYSGGRKATGNQRTAEANSTDFPGVLATNPWALRENYVASNSDNLQVVQATADTELQKKIARKTATGIIQDTETYSYGRDYLIGDKVSVAIDNERFTVYLDSEEGTLENETETLNIGFNSDTYQYVSSPTPAIYRTAQESLFVELFKRVQDLQSTVRQHEILFADYDLG